MGEKPSRGRKEEDAWHGMPLHATMKRVKVYRLEDNGKWDDQGTGHVTIDYIEGSRELVLAVVDEEDNDTLLLHNITPDDIYRKQEERIISWRDPEKALELALSFQEAEGCSFIWENMRNIREDAQSKILSSLKVGPKPALKPLVASRGSFLHGKSSSSVNGDLKKLPPPEMPSLSVILKTMQCGTTEQKQLITNSISKDVVSFLKDNAAFIQDLFERRKSSNVSSKNELVFFLRKFCNVSKSLQPDQQITLSRDLANQGVFDIVSDVLQSQDKVLVSAGTDILLYFLTQDPDLLRSYIANHGEKSGEDISLLGLLFKRMVTDFSGEMLCQFLEILRILLDAVNNSAVVKIFYKKYFERLIDIIESSCPPKSIAGSTFGSVGVVTSFEMVTICDFLCFCVVKHPCMTKINFLKSYSIKKILTLTRRREKVLVVAAVRFIRTVIGTNDELLTSLVIKFNMLKPIIEAFVENGDRDNLLQSTALELFEYITKENRKSLIVYVVGSFWNQLVKFEQREIIQAFRLKYEEIRNSTETEETTSVGHMRKKADERGLDKEEEDCFNTDSNHEDSATQTTQVQQRCMVKPAGGSEIRHIPARPKSGGLMDHDDDKYYNRPPKRPVEADETFNTLTARHRSLDGKDIDGNILKKSKLEARVSFSKINVLANVVGKHSDLEDTQPPLIPASSTISSDGNDGAREASPGSPNLQPPESFDYLAGDSSSEMVVATAETADSDPCPFSL